MAPTRSNVQSLRWCCFNLNSVIKLCSEPEAFVVGQAQVYSNHFDIGTNTNLSGLPLTHVVGTDRAGAN